MNINLGNLGSNFKLDLNSSFKGLRETSDVASSIQPIQRRGPFTFKNLKPNTKYKVFFQDLNITEWCYGYGGSRGYKPKGVSGDGNRYGQTFLWTDEDGDLSFSMYWLAWQKIPRGTVEQLMSMKEKTLSEESITLIPFGTTLNTTNVTINNKTLEKLNVIAPTSNTAPVKIAKDIADQLLGVQGVGKFVLPKQPKLVKRASQIRTRTIKQEADFDYVQTFFLNDAKLGGAKTVDLTGINLYFKKKPNPISGKGRKDKGVIVSLIDVEDGIPVFKREYESSKVALTLSEINTSSDASIATTFDFDTPVRVKTGKYYAFTVAYQDNVYELWTCKVGDRKTGTNTKSGGAQKDHQGDLYIGYKNKPNASKSYIKQKASTTEDLKFDIEGCEYESAVAAVNIVNEDYEFFTMGTVTGDYIGGEYVYKDSSTLTGTISITGNDRIITGVNTTFTADFNDDDWILLTDGTAGNTEIFEISDVKSDTRIIVKNLAPYSITNGTHKKPVVAQVYHWDPLGDTLICTDSEATSTNRFEVGSTVIGIDSGASGDVSTLDVLPISAFTPKFDLDIPSRTTVIVEGSFTYFDGTNFRVSTTSDYTRQIEMNSPNFLEQFINSTSQAVYTPYILSRSSEVVNGTHLYDENDDGTGDKSCRIRILYRWNGETATTYESPDFDVENSSIATSYFEINNDYANEHTNDGEAASKHISKKLVFGDGVNAEDVRVIYTAHKPPGTDFKCYAKIINESDPDLFDDKFWTELEVTSGNENVFSDVSDLDDLIEVEFGFPAYPPSASTLSGTVDTNAGTTVVTGVNTTFTSDLSSGDVVKIYSPLFEENYGIFLVDTVDNDLQITLHEAVANVNIQDTGLKIDKISTPYTAFNNTDNFNIVRYFSQNGGVYDTYNAIAIKTVLLSDSSTIVPSIDDYRVIGVSA